MIASFFLATGLEMKRTKNTTKMTKGKKVSLNKYPKSYVFFQILNSTILTISDDTRLEDESDTPTILKLEDVFSDDYFYEFNFLNTSVKPVA